MKPKHLLLPIILIAPLYLLGQEIMDAAKVAAGNNLIVEQLAAQLGFTASPFFGVFLTSIASHLDIGSEFIRSSPIYGNIFILIISGLLTFAKPIISGLSGFLGPAKAPLAAVSTGIEWIEGHATAAIFALAAIGWYLSTPDELSSESVVMLGFAMPFKMAFVLFVGLTYLTMVSTVRLMIDLLVLIIPIPFIDTVLLALKYIFTTGLVAISIFFPKLALVILALFYVLAWILYRRSKRVAVKQRILLMEPMFHKVKFLRRFTLKSYAQSKHIDGDVYPIFLAGKRKPFKRHRKIFISFSNNGAELIQPKTFLFKEKRESVFITGIKSGLTRCRLFQDEVVIGFTSSVYKKDLSAYVDNQETESSEEDIKSLALNG